MDHLKKLAAYQKLDNDKYLKSNVKLSSVKKNSPSCMCKGRTFTGGSMHLRADEAYDQGSKRRKDAAEEDAIARILRAAPPSRPTTDRC